MRDANDGTLRSSSDKFRSKLGKSGDGEARTDDVDWEITLYDGVGLGEQ